MRVLAIETSGSVGSVALGTPPDIQEALLPLPAPGERPVHGRLLAPMVAELLARRGWTPPAVELCVVGLGPGSYTGVRVGLAFVKGFALPADCPIVGVSSLEVLAHNGPADAGEVLVVRDARWGEVYWARFRRTAGGIVRAAPDAVGALADCDATGAAVVGDPARADAERLGVAPLGDPDHPARVAHARHAATIGLAHYRTHGATPGAALAPAYLRASEAERRAGIPGGGPAA